MSFHRIGILAPIIEGDSFYGTCSYGEFRGLDLKTGEIDRTKLIEPDTESGYGPRRFANSIVNWCHPAFANRHDIIRNDHEMFRVSLAKQ